MALASFNPGPGRELQNLRYATARAGAGRSTGQFHTDLELPFTGIPRPRPPAIAALSDEDKAFIAAAYDEEIAWVDVGVARLLEGLEERGLRDRAVVVLTSDHGEELFDYGLWEHGHSMQEEVVRVPLIVWAPGIEARRESTPVSLVDLPQTVLDALGLPLLPEAAGASLWDRLAHDDPPGRRPIVAEHSLYGSERKAVLDWPLKAIHRANGDRWWLFDLERDPGETRDLSGEQLAELRQLQVQLTGILAETAASSEPDEVVLDPETLEELRSLGYIR